MLCCFLQGHFASRTSMSDVAWAARWFICSCGFLALMFALTNCFSMHIYHPGFLWQFVWPLKFAMNAFFFVEQLFCHTYRKYNMRDTTFQKQCFRKCNWNDSYPNYAQKFIEDNFILLFITQNFLWLSWTGNLHLCDTLAVISYKISWKSLYWQTSQYFV